MSGEQRPTFVCAHTFAAPGAYRTWITGVGNELRWACEACAAQYPSAAPDQPIDDAWWQTNRYEGYSIGYVGGVGVPEVRRQITTAHFVAHTGPLPIGADVVDVQPWHGHGDAWLVLHASGDLAIWPPTDDAVVAPRDLGFPIDDGCALVVSRRGGHAAIVQASGSEGALFDLATGAIVARLHRGTYHVENSRFPCAFVDHDGHELLVVGSEWNRLELVDVATGADLASRPEVPHASPLPRHYLDYFHGLLVGSPDGASVADAGWVWHPVGIVRVWRLDAWLTNPWESEDGPSLRTLPMLQDWDGPMCWIDDQTLIRYGWSDGDEWQLPAISVLDATTGAVKRWFVGPNVRPAPAWPPRTLRGALGDALVFDEVLFAISDTHGIEAWDVATGTCIAHAPTLTPVRYHPTARVFLSLLPDGGALLSRFVMASP